ncbi:MAG: response regulator [Desulfobacterales bacterium]|nr:response regulator [Desulfobacterales bacterium]
MKNRLAGRIMLVDDDELVREAFRTLIRKMGYSCDAVSSGEEALERLQTGRFDIVLCAIVMGEMDGLEFMKDAGGIFPQTDFIMMTGHAGKYSYSDIIEAGAIDFLVKPFDSGKLRSRLERALKERRLLRQVKESEKKYSALVKNSPDIIFTLGPEGIISFIGGAVKGLLGLTAEELLGKHFSSIVYPDDTEISVRDFNERQSENIGAKRHEVRFRIKQGRPMWFDLYCMPLYEPYEQLADARENVFAGTHIVARNITERKWAQDALQKAYGELERRVEERTVELARAVEQLQNEITERKRAEEQLLQSKKLASIGQLAAGIAHEINNPASFISVNAVTMEKWWKLFEPILDKAMDLGLDREVGVKKVSDMIGKFHGMIESVKEGTARISKITGGLTQFSRSDHEKREPVDIRQALETAVVMTGNQYRYHADLVVEGESDLPKIFGNSQKLEQVFVNLIVNASDAIKEKTDIMKDRNESFRGLISITAFFKKTPEKAIEIVVKDNGVGMDADVMEKVFDPFYTTKPRGKGTGLGMSIVYGIIRDHGGSISVESREGEGTAFTITLLLEQRKAKSTAEARS